VEGESTVMSKLSIVGAITLLGCGSVKSTPVDGATVDAAATVDAGPGVDVGENANHPCRPARCW
jgi:hypothetical protein